MALRYEFDYVNPGGQHLPLQMVGIPETLWVCSVAFAALMAAVTVALTMIWPHSANLLHMLFVGCLWLKSTELALKWKFFEILSSTGSAPNWRYQMWQLGAKFHDIFEIVLLL